jgi:rhodanese-related sulfurtransferase
MVPLEISPTEVKQRIDTLTLIDVREPAEHQLCQIPGARLIPMRTIPEQLKRLEELPGPLIIFCHHGVRSLRVVEWLREQGLTDCQSMAGGIEAWSLMVDRSVPRY